MTAWNWYRDRKLRNLLEAQISGTLEVVTDREVRRILFKMRVWYAVEPFVTPILRLSSFIWSYIYGGYRRASAKIYGRPHEASGGGAGATVSPITTFVFTSASVPISTASRTVEDAGIRAGEVVGYRGWYLEQDGLLRSITQDTIWVPGEVVEGPGLDANNYRGVHAFKDPLAVGSYSYFPNHSKIVVSGTVELWGTVIEHERGWRASHAAIRSIDSSPNYDATALRKRYGLTKKRSRKPVDKGRGRA